MFDGSECVVFVLKFLCWNFRGIYSKIDYLNEGCIIDGILFYWI